jgi:hypothetical protein
MKRTVLIAAALLGALTLGVAMADDDDCRVPMAQWQPREAVAEMAKARGWTVDRIKVDDGCYGVRGIDENGRSFRAKVNPATLAVMRMKIGHDGHHRRDRDDDDGNRRGRTAKPARAGSAAPPDNGLFGKGVPEVGVQ